MDKEMREFPEMGISIVLRRLITAEFVNSVELPPKRKKWTSAARSE
jgi:hypothetical protein